MNVIILCQGVQARLPDLTVPKQLLELPACGTTILERTLKQLERMKVEPSEITVVAGERIRNRLLPERHFKLHANGVDADLYLTQRGHRVLTLLEPGNSSLIGVDQVLKLWDASFYGSLILLGDVIYSSACFHALLEKMTPNGYGFVGSSNLSPSGGEIWGVAWGSHDDLMRAALARAVAKHPDHRQVYQPGQLRGWLWELGGRGQPAEGGRVNEWCPEVFTAVDDYTMDVDVPTDLERLPGADTKAALEGL